MTTSTHPASTAAERQRLIIPDWLPDPLSNGPHGHWSTRQKKLRNAQDTVWAHAQRVELQPVAGRARLTIILAFGNHRRRDTDNLYARVKGCVDGLVHGGWIRDDSTEWLELVVRAEVRPRQKATEIWLEPIP